MEIFISIAHIAGSIIVFILFSILIVYLAMIEGKKIQKNLLDEASVALGIPVEKFESEEYYKVLLEYSSKKYSSDLFQNRVSDFLGTIRTLWGWLSSIIQLIIFVTVCWYTITDSLENAVHAWWIVAIGIGFWFVSSIFSLICYLFTGRYPGQAKSHRLSAAAWVKENEDVLLRNE